MPVSLGLGVRTKNILLKLQRYTGADNVYIAKQGGFLWAGNIINLGLSFLLSVAFARFISKETYGSYQYILSMVGILTMFTIPDMLDALTQSTAAGFESSIFTATKTRLKAGLLGTLAAIGVGIYFLVRGNMVVAVSLFIASAFIPLVETYKNYQGYLGGKKKFDVSSIYGIISQILYSAIMLVAIIFFKNVIGLVLVFFTANLAVNLYFYLRTLKNFPPQNKEIDSKISSYGIHLTLSGVFGVISSQIDRILTFSILGPQNLAIYAFATAPVDKIKGLLTPIATLALPKFAEKSKDEVKKNIHRRLWQLSFLAAGLMIFWFFAAPYIYKIFFPAYIASVWLSQIYVFKYIGLPASILPVVFRSQKMLKPIYFINITGELFLILMYVVLLTKFQLLGLVWAAILTALYRSILMLVFLKKM